METGDSASISNQEGKTVAYFRREIRKEWNELWNQRIEDKQIAEDVARKDYNLLFIETGTVIRATRNFKPLDLEEIIDANEKLLGVSLKSPTSGEGGGYRKFAKETLSKQPHVGRLHSRKREILEKKKNDPPKNTGRGWLHSH
ncbi:MAG: hypothetical protein QG670_589 [Thermoproteota archaeon]|nr:hypothetical protein [Thermoproteota archaeon]